MKAAALHAKPENLYMAVQNPKGPGTHVLDKWAETYLYTLNPNPLGPKYLLCGYLDPSAPNPRRKTLYPRGLNVQNGRGARGLSATHLDLGFRF